jgi:hypothetical protein
MKQYSKTMNQFFIPKKQFSVPRNLIPIPMKQLSTPLKRSGIRYLIPAIFILFLLLVSCSQGQLDKGQGTLHVSEINPRYFTDNSGKAVYLTGSHTWNNLVDMEPAGTDHKFDFESYIQWMKGYNHNFMRLWTWELFNWDTQANKVDSAQNLITSPLCWVRTGPGNALDGNPKFDLGKHNPEYFKRLKQRVQLAADSGIYVSIMLFEGWGLQFCPNAFENHPFHPDNNINGINGDSNGDGSGIEIHTLINDEILTIQEDYIQEVIETVNEFDNVLYEISNENHPPSTAWQYHMISFIKEFEKQLPKQHPVGMTFQYKGGSNQTLFESPADWISPNPEGGYGIDPPAGNGSKVIITDTDHLWGIGGNQQWVWKSFLRGLNPIFMDPYGGSVLQKFRDLDWTEPLRKSMGYTLMFAQKMDLIRMVPAPNLASSTYCLANKGKEYLVYLPENQEVTIDLAGSLGNYLTEWFDPTSGAFRTGEAVEGGAERSLTSPFGETDAVLYLKLE